MFRFKITSQDSGGREACRIAEMEFISDVALFVGARIDAYGSHRLEVWDRIEERAWPLAEILSHTPAEVLPQPLFDEEGDDPFADDVALLDEPAPNTI